MQVYVQKSMSTTRPRSPSICSGSVLNQWPGLVEIGRRAEQRQLRRLHAGQGGVARRGLARRDGDVVVVELRLAAQAGELVLDGGALLQAAGRVGRGRTGKWSASASWKRRSTLVNMSTAVSSITAPKPRCSPPPRPRRRTRSITRRPPSARPSSTTRRAEPVGDRHRDDLRRRARRGADGDDRGEDRAGARRVDEAERAADRQPRPEAVGVAAGREALQEGQAQLEPVRRGAGRAA